MRRVDYYTSTAMTPVGRWTGLQIVHFRVNHVARCDTQKIVDCSAGDAFPIESGPRGRTSAIIRSTEELWNVGDESIYVDISLITDRREFRQ